MVALRAMLEDLVARFNERARTDPRMREELEGLERRIQVVTEHATYRMRLEAGKIVDLEEAEAQGEADLTIAADEEVLRGVIAREIAPFKALATGKLKVKASLEDTLRFRKLLS